MCLVLESLMAYCVIYMPCSFYNCINGIGAVSKEIRPADIYCSSGDSIP